MPRAVRVWLWLSIGLVTCMVSVGGITRLTGSGLSIVEWAPVHGVLPPIGDDAWRRALSQYGESPEGKLRNLDLAAFRAIFLVEWAHRLLARLLGVVLLMPVFLPTLRDALDARLRRRVFVVLGLAATQAVMGWLMVKSGLVDVPHVSPYRLVAHLLLGFALFGVLLSTALEAEHVEARTNQLLLVPVLILVTVATGGAMAGTHGGLLFPSFPTMNGAWVPSSVFDRGVRAIFEDPITAHFDHRVAALVSLVLAIALVVRRTDRRRSLFAAAVMAQIGLGAAVVLMHVPTALAALHQLGGLLVFATAVYVAR